MKQEAFWFVLFVSEHVAKQLQRKERTITRTGTKLVRLAPNFYMARERTYSSIDVIDTSVVARVRLERLHIADMRPVINMCSIA
jgi:hypothetical protein